MRTRTIGRAAQGGRRPKRRNGERPVRGVYVPTAAPRCEQARAHRDRIIAAQGGRRPQHRTDGGPGGGPGGGPVWGGWLRLAAHLCEHGRAHRGRGRAAQSWRWANPNSIGLKLGPLGLFGTF